MSNTIPVYELKVDTELTQRHSVKDDFTLNATIMRKVLAYASLQPWYDNSLVFSGFNDRRSQETNDTHGSRRAFFGVTETEWLKKINVYQNHSNTPGSYALLGAGIPTIAVYDGTLLMPGTKHPEFVEALDAEDWDKVHEFSNGLMFDPDCFYTPKVGKTLDEAIQVAIQLVE
ncbi:MAG: hypothetical protein JWM81_237 [Candidatus Saccharibacteria bacterium]|nr:hypothetical protein [Candidatus Saccharibacteria bacterium]